MPLITTSLLFLSSQIVAVSREPDPPDAAVHVFDARCGADRLRITGYGNGRRRAVSIRANGREVSGALAEDLRGGLSNPRVVYRLTAQCPQSGGIELHINSGVRDYEADRQNVHVDYVTGQAIFKNGRLVAYEGLREGSAESFWFH